MVSSLKLFHKNGFFNTFSLVYIVQQKSEFFQPQQRTNFRVKNRSLPVQGAHIFVKT